MNKNTRSVIMAIGLMLGLSWASALPAAAEVGATPPEYLKAVTYVSDAWVINFWNTESDHMETELAQIAADGFNSIILVIPWREFQPGTNPVSYNNYAFQKLDKVMGAAQQQGLWVELRVSYTWDYYGEEESRLRFRRLLGDDKLRQAWLEYIKKMYDTVSAYPNYHGGFITWEDFWNYMEDATGFGTGKGSVEEARRIGLQDYLQKNYTLEELNQYYRPLRSFGTYQEVYMPSKQSPAYKLLFEFYDDYLIQLLLDAQHGFPNLSMEVRLDVDPVKGMGGETVGAHHFQTFPCGDATYTSLMYSVAMGQVNNGEEISAAQALAAADAQLNVVKVHNGNKPIFIDQLLYMDATEEFSHNAQIIEEERNTFITSLPEIFNKYTMGYAVWSYWNYTNNPVYNSQFALGDRGWTVSRGKIVERDDSNQMKLESSGSLSQKIGSRIDGKRSHANHVRFVADSDEPTTLYVDLGRITKEVQIDGKKQYDLNFGQLDYTEVTFRTNKSAVYLDNIEVYNFIQDGQLHDIDGNELSSISAIRELNRLLAD